MTTTECGTAVGNLRVLQAATRDVIVALLDQPSERARDAMRDHVVALLDWEHAHLATLVRCSGAEQLVVADLTEQRSRLRAELNATVWSPADSVEFWQAVRRLGEVLVAHMELTEQVLSG